MKLAWAPLAITDRAAIFGYIEAVNPQAAIAMDVRIATQARRLIRFPHAGRAGRVPGTRELVINGTPYVAAYAVRGDTVVILRVLHGARNWPDDMA